MIKHSFREAFRLIMRSKAVCLGYLAACLLSEALVIMLCRRFGLDYPPGGSKLEAANLIYLAACSLPGLLITAWVGAGLVGRISLDAYTGAPDSAVNYANGWFVRNLTGMVLIAAAAFLPAMVFTVLPKGLAAFVMLAWFLVFIWLAIRVSLWANIMFIEELGTVAAMRRSYNLSEGYVATLVILSLPFLVGAIWGIVLPHYAAGNVVLISLSKNLLIGAATLIQTGALATAYIMIKREVVVPGADKAVSEGAVL